MPEVMVKDRPVPIQFSLRVEKVDEDKWFFRGIASTDDIDLVGDIITEEALKASEDDLLKNSTIFLNHNRKHPIGRTVATEFRPGKGLEIVGMISRTEPEIWRKIQEGVLNKLSIGAVVLNAERGFDDKTNQPVVRVTRMLLKEHSLVSLPANPEARNLAWWVKKSLEDTETGSDADAVFLFEPYEKGDGLSKSESPKGGEREKAMAFEAKALAEIGKRIVMIREQRHFDVDQLAEKTGLEVDNMKAIEAGEFKELDEKMVQRVAEALGVRFEDLARQKEDGSGHWDEGSPESGKTEPEAKPDPEPEAKKDEAYEVSEDELKAIEAESTKKTEEKLSKAKEEAEKASEIAKQDARVKQIKFLLGRLKKGPNEQVSTIAKQIEALVDRAMGSKDPYPYPSAYPYPQKELDEFRELVGKVADTMKGLTERLDGITVETTKADEPEKTPEKKTESRGREVVEVIRKGEGDRKDLDPKADEKAEVERILKSDDPFAAMVRSGKMLVNVR